MLGVTRVNDGQIIIQGGTIFILLRNNFFITRTITIIPATKKLPRTNLKFVPATGPVCCYCQNNNNHGPVCWTNLDPKSKILWAGCPSDRSARAAPKNRQHIQSGLNLTAAHRGVPAVADRKPCVPETLTDAQALFG